MYGEDEYMDGRGSGGMVAWEEDDEGMLYGDEDGGGFIHMEKVELDEVSKTNMMLLQNEFRLYQEEYDYDEAVEEKRRQKMEDDRPRYFSEGYEANVDPADDVELARWQSQFPYFQVVGVGYQDVAAEELDAPRKYSKEEEEDIPWVEIPHTEEVDQLVIVGKKLTIAPCDVQETGDDGEVIEEVIAQDGVLEEIIEIDCRPAEDASRPHSPPTVIKEEISSELMDIIWPDIVQSLGPFVRKIFELADAQGITTDIEEIRRINIEARAPKARQDDFFDDW